jgi:hypothetical protein
LNEGVGEGIAMGRFRKLFAGVSIEFGLGVEGFDVRDAAEHEEPDDAFGFRGEVGLTAAMDWGVRRVPRARPARPSAGVGEEDAAGFRIGADVSTGHGMFLLSDGNEVVAG